MRHLQLGFRRGLDRHDGLVSEPVDGAEVLVRHVGVTLILIEELEVELRISDEIVELVLLGLKVGQVSVEVGVLGGEALVVLGARPGDHVLALLLDQADAFQDVGDVVDPPLLHVERLGGFVEVDRARG